ncbi:porin [Elizabethkingia sp. JS20170427COW]|uniref:porin n=1 Tax=Elizabethkingia sp. JS20170427COW TaxID=2583851 RepID=UPI00111066E1|nr:porin [Elizabethkingia sp. JS20170427COW]QCX54199.1 hypothetical protein FGE20_10835 [Elizabethkingia sp. JS20170427COW]
MKSFTAILCVLGQGLLMAQGFRTDSDTLTKPLIPIENVRFMKNIRVNLDIRGEFMNHFENGRDDNYTEFRNKPVSLDISGKVHEKISFRFRNRFNNSSQIQSLDMLDNSIDLAYVNLKVTPKTDVRIGKMFAFFGGYEYEYNPIEILEYNEALGNLTAFVTGLGVTHQVFPNHQFGIQILNSRTMRFKDLYENQVSDDVQEPNWPVAVVANWKGNLFDGKFQTIYSYSNFKNAKGHASTNAIHLGNRLQLDKFALMYDFNYSVEQLDSKGIVTQLLNNGKIAKDATYMEHWMRAEYKISPRFEALISLMTSGAYAKNAYSTDSGNNHLRQSYAFIPTVYYKPFKDSEVKFFLAYIGKYYQHSQYIRDIMKTSNYHTGEIRVGLIAPLRLF